MTFEGKLMVPIYKIIIINTNPLIADDIALLLCQWKSEKFPDMHEKQR